MAKVGRNEKCPCGSGKKYKHCCLGKVERRSYTTEDRVDAHTLLAAFTQEYLSAAREEAWSELWVDQADRANEPGQYFRDASEAYLDAWFWFDRPLHDDDPARLVDVVLRDQGLPAGPRAYLEQMRDSSVRLYEVADVVPGASIRLVDLVGGGEVTVTERTLSRTASRGDGFALRIVATGASGHPEIDLSALSIPALIRDDLCSAVIEARDALRRDIPAAGEQTFWKWIAPQLIHEWWMAAVLDPVIPRLANTDGEPLVLTRVRFAVADRDRLGRALATISGIEEARDGEWSWSTTDRDNPVSLGHLRLVNGEELHLECNSVARGERGRALVEQAAGSAVRFVAASHEDPTETLRQHLRDRANGREDAEADPDPLPIPREVIEELTLTHLGRHYRDWVDHPVPALGGATPREASKRVDLVPEVVSLIRGIEGQYQDALRAGEPAYDPSWMWEELDLVPPGRPDTVAPAHDRLDAAYPGLGVLTRQVAHRLRDAPHFDEASTRCRPEDLEADLAVMRFLREQPATCAIVPWLVDFELHRRKTFAVDRALSWMLLHTELEVEPTALRLPFQSFALVYTDRPVLSLAERLLASTRSGSPLVGHFARIVTVHVRASDARVELSFVIDAAGSDPPEVVEHVVPLDEGSIRGGSAEGTPLPLAGLVHATVSAILYATSPSAPSPSFGGARMATRSVPPADVAAPVSDHVFHLPGTIDISRLRQLETLERIPSGRKLLHRFLVRGHWRRPAKSHKDQRLRWIEPYWKGPELAAVVEKAYRLVP